MNDRGLSLVDRYVYAVRRLLPRAQRDDIASELRDILQSQLEDEEAARQHPLSDDEVGNILRTYGNPRDVAARYGSRHYLIGPEVFPSYVTSVKFVLWFMAFFALLMMSITVLIEDDGLASGIAETIWTTVSIGLVNIAIVTLIFSYAGRTSGPNESHDWDPADLPEFQPDPQDPIRRSDAIGSLLGLIAMLAWWLGVNSAIRPWFGLDPLPFEWAAVWTEVHYAAVAVILASMARETFALFRPYWTRLYAGAGAALNLFGLLVLIRLLGARAYVSATQDATAAGFGGMLVQMFDKMIFAGLLVGTIVAAASLVTGTYRFLRLTGLRTGRSLGSHLPSG